MIAQAGRFRATNVAHHPNGDVWIMRADLSLSFVESVKLYNGTWPRESPVETGRLARERHDLESGVVSVPCRDVW